MQILDYIELIESDEELVPLKVACKTLFRPPISSATIVRYSSVGVRGVRLKTAKVGACRCTTQSAVMEFTIAQLQNPVSSDNESAHDAPKRLKRSAKKIGGGMTPGEIATGLARHKLD